MAGYPAMDARPFLQGVYMDRGLMKALVTLVGKLTELADEALKAIKEEKARKRRAADRRGGPAGFDGIE